MHRRISRTDGKRGQPLQRQTGTAQWTPRELRHSFVSLLSDAGVPIEQNSHLVGHSGTTTAETIYRKQIRPVLVGGADAMDLIFPTENGERPVDCSSAMPTGAT